MELQWLSEGEGNVAAQEKKNQSGEHHGVGGRKVACEHRQAQACQPPEHLLVPCHGGGG